MRSQLTARDRRRGDGSKTEFSYSKKGGRPWPKLQVNQMQNCSACLNESASLPPEECERITRLSWQTIKRQYKDKIVYLSKRRPGISVEDLLEIVNG